MYRYYNPVRTYEGYGSLAQLSLLAQECASPDETILLLVWNESVLEVPEIAEFAAREKYHLVVQPFAASNPELGQLYDMYCQTRMLNVGLVIAIGGGSVLDVGKSLCCLYGREIPSEDALRQIIRDKTYGPSGCRWIGVPTTAGTGSEVTCWATVWDSPNNAKYSVDTPQNYAYAAVVDPALAASMPLTLAVSSALDAVAHATESYWAKASNTVSKALALRAIRTILESIDELLIHNGSRFAHAAMAKGSMLAGLAFSNTRTSASHSISYPLTMQCHIPHGVAVSLLMGPVLELNQPAIADMDALLDAFGVREPYQVGERITAILEAAGHPVRLRRWGASEAMLPQLAKHSMTKGRADNNPVELTETVVYNILKSIL